ncbi:MAG: peptidase M50, partial [Phycisphaerae bacterium]|nr:peptidase M50 [Phycisphaerae bacterium]
MPIQRPTFHESWHRVVDLRPRLRPGTRTIRQTSRGSVWHIVEDATGSQYFRMNDSAWRFVGLLDGRITVGEAWTMCQSNLGDEAPTQGEAIQILGQLYSSNLLQADVSGDAAAMFRRQRQRVSREVRSYLLNMLFLRVPLWDPDAFLTRWTPLFGWLFTPLGFALWLILLVIGAFHLIGHAQPLALGLSGVLAPDNLIWLYVVYALIKGVHELGHAFACKAFGRRTSDTTGTAGQVHTIGVMFLLFMPVPYVDASSSWLLKNKMHRMFVAAAGIIVELAIAAIAAVVWSRTAEGTIIHSLAYNAIILAGVSTLLFNGNPLMRYDGYYILADLIEIPNLAQRSQAYLNYLVKRYAYGVSHAVSPAYTAGERCWLIFYQVASSVCRVVVYAAIALFIIGQRFVLGGAIIAMVALAWLLLPLGRFVRYLASDPELSRQRPRAVLATAGALLIVGSAVLLIPFPDHARIEGVVEPRRFENIHASADGLIAFAAPSGVAVSRE